MMLGPFGSSREQATHVVASISSRLVMRRLPRREEKYVAIDEDELLSPPTSVVVSMLVSALREVVAAVVVVFEDPAAAEGSGCDPIGIVNGTRTRSSCSAWSSGLALPIAVVAASDCSSVEIGGRPAASAIRKNVLARNAASTTVMRSGFESTGNESVDVFSDAEWDSDGFERERVSELESVRDWVKVAVADMVSACEGDTVRSLRVAESVMDCVSDAEIVSWCVDDSEADADCDDELDTVSVEDTESDADLESE